MKVNELAKRGGVTAETVRHYAREQLLAPSGTLIMATNFFQTPT